MEVDLRRGGVDRPKVSGLEVDLRRGHRGFSVEVRVAVVRSLRVLLVVERIMGLVIVRFEGEREIHLEVALEDYHSQSLENFGLLGQSGQLLAHGTCRLEVST